MKKLSLVALTLTILFTTSTLPTYAVEPPTKIAYPGTSCAVEKAGISVYVYGRDIKTPIQPNEVCDQLKFEGFSDSNHTVRTANYVVETSFQEGGDDATPGVMLRKNTLNQKSAVVSFQVGRMAFDYVAAIRLLKLIE